MRKIPIKVGCHIGILIVSLFCCTSLKVSRSRGAIVDRGWVHGNDRRFPRRTDIIFCSYNFCYRKRKYRFEVALPFSRKCDSFRISPAFSRSRIARFTVERDRDKSIAMRLIPGHAFCSLSQRSCR